MTVSEWRNLTICSRGRACESCGSIIRRIVFDESNLFVGVVKGHPAKACSRPFAPLGCLADDKSNVPVERSPLAVKHHPANGVNIHFPHAPRQHPRKVSAPLVNFTLTAPVVGVELAAPDGWWSFGFHVGKIIRATVASQFRARIK